MKEGSGKNAIHQIPCSKTSKDRQDEFRGSYRLFLVN